MGTSITCRNFQKSAPVESFTFKNCKFMRKWPYVRVTDLCSLCHAFIWHRCMHAADRSLLDNHTCDDWSLLSHTPLCKEQLLAIKHSHESSLDMEYPSHPLLFSKRELAVGGERGLAVFPAPWTASQPVVVDVIFRSLSLTAGTYIHTCPRPFFLATMVNCSK